MAYCGEPRPSGFCLAECNQEQQIRADRNAQSFPVRPQKIEACCRDGMVSQHPRLPRLGKLPRCSGTIPTGHPRLSEVTELTITNPTSQDASSQPRPSKEERVQSQSPALTRSHRQILEYIHYDRLRTTFHNYTKNSPASRVPK